MMILLKVIFVVVLSRETVSLLNSTTVGKGVLITPLRDVLIKKGELIINIPLSDIQLNQFVSSLTHELKDTDLKHWQGMSTYSSCSELLGDWSRFGKPYVKPRKASQTSRKKRGLLDLGGEILNKLFGVTTDKELKELERDIGRRMGLHTIQLNKLTRLADLQREVQNSLIYGLKTLTNETSENFNILARKIIDDEIASYCSVYQALKLDLELGHLNKHLIDLEDLGRVMDKYRKEWQLTSVSLDEPLEFEQSVQTKVVRLPEGNRVALMSIPFFEPERYVAYQFRPFPMRAENSTRKMALKMDNQLIILDKGKSKFATKNKEFLEQCTKQFRGALICPNLLFFFLWPQTRNPSVS